MSLFPPLHQLLLWYVDFSNIQLKIIEEHPFRRVHLLNSQITRSHIFILYNHRLPKYFQALNLCDKYLLYASSSSRTRCRISYFYIKPLREIYLSEGVFSCPYHICQEPCKHLLCLSYLLVEKLSPIYSGISGQLCPEFLAL